MSQFQNILIIFYYIVYTLFHHISPTSASNYHHYDDLHVPCTFFDTINITDNSVKFTNGSYLYDDILLPSHLVGLYDYVYTDLATRVDVTPHLRGCVCQVKPCINLCCPRGSHNVNSTALCEKDDKYEAKVPLLNVTMGQNQTNTMAVGIFDHFATQIFLPSAKMHRSTLPWTLYENGTVKYSDNGTFDFMEKIEYCLMFSQDENNDELYTVYPIYFKDMAAYDLLTVIQAFSFAISLPFILLTIIVYLCIPQLLNNHGKSFVFHLISLLAAIIIALSLELLPSNRIVCVLGGCTINLALTASFCWLSVISFDLWYSFSGNRSINRSKESKRFLFYSLYAWGIPLLMGLTCTFLNYYTDVSLEFVTNYDFDECIRDDDLSGLIFNAGPILVLILINTIFFAMTALKIYKAQREIANVMAGNDSTTNLHNQKDEFSLFLRLFMLMGISWLPIAIEPFIDKKWRKYLFIFNVIGYAHGVLIFVMFVLKKKVRRLISQRCCCSNKRQHNNLSTRTTSSTMPSTTS